MLGNRTGEAERGEQSEPSGEILVDDSDALNPGPMFACALEGLKPSHSGGGSWTPLSLEEVQRELSQYTLIGLIGRGGMGAVYQARQDTLDRLVAIKILSRGIDCDDVQFAERFKQEARAMAKFKHPGIVGVHDAGETPGGLLYFVMEFIEGSDVGQRLAREGRLASGEAIRITAKVCEALAYAHDHGVVHRDIKPANVMLEADGTVKVADFGLAKITSPNGGGFTRSDMALGSPDFAAPECFLFGIQPDGRADIYSVGVMLYQMLTGMLPRGRFDPPSGVVTPLDKRLDAIVDKAMQTDREKRYASALDLKADVERLITGHRVVSAANKRRPFVLLLLIGVAVLLGLMIAVTIVHQRADPRSGEARSVAATVQNTRSQWRKIEFAAIAPMAATAGRSRLTMEGGLLHIHDWDRWMAPVTLGTPGARFQRNVAIRATIRVNGNSRHKLSLRLRRPPDSQYFVVVYPRSLCLGRQIGMDMKNLRHFEMPHIPKEGADATFQLACVGHRLYVWFEGVFLGHVEDREFDQTGEFGIQAKDGWFKSFEYILLDSLSESEALKLIGIEQP